MSVHSNWSLGLGLIFGPVKVNSPVDFLFFLLPFFPILPPLWAHQPFFIFFFFSFSFFFSWATSCFFFLLQSPHLSSILLSSPFWASFFISWIRETTERRARLDGARSTAALDEIDLGSSAAEKQRRGWRAVINEVTPTSKELKIEARIHGGLGKGSDGGVGLQGRRRQQQLGGRSGVWRERDAGLLVARLTAERWDENGVAGTVDFASSFSFFSVSASLFLLCRFGDLGWLIYVCGCTSWTERMVSDCGELVMGK